MEVLIVSDQEINENKNISELLSRVDYMVEKNFSLVQKRINQNSYNLVVFLTIHSSFPDTWLFSKLKSQAAIMTMTKVDKLDLVIFSSFLKSIGLFNEPLIKSRKEDELPPLLYKSLVFIEENIHENDLSLEKVASNVYISRCHYSRMFKTFFGTGFKDYVISKRIQKAKQMLQKGVTVTEVCYAVGYGDLTHFGRMFKKVVGINPSIYRKKYFQKVQDAHVS